MLVLNVYLVTISESLLLVMAICLPLVVRRVICLCLDIVCSSVFILLDAIIVVAHLVS